MGKLVKIIGIIISVIILSLAFQKYFISQKNHIALNSVPENAYTVCKSGVYIMEKSTILFIPNDVSLTKNGTLKHFIALKDYKHIQILLNDTLDNAVTKTEFHQKVELSKDANIVTVPLIDIGKKQFINSVLLAEEMDSGYVVNKDINSTFYVDIYNASGERGAAGSVATMLSQKYGYQCSALNYKQNLNYTYIENRGMSQEALKQIVSNINKNYIKVGDFKSLDKGMAKAIIVLGRDSGDPIGVQIVSKSKNDRARDLLNKLHSKGYKNIRLTVDESTIDNSYISYNSSDYYTALKISNITDVSTMKEDNTLKGIIKIFKK